MIRIGARWDGAEQTARFEAAAKEGLLDFIEANFPLHRHDEPKLDLPVYVHTADTALASAFGLNDAHCSVIEAAGRRFDSPWVGEHLSMLATSAEGALGYLINTPLLGAFADIAVENTRVVQQRYGRPVALELGPHYQHVGALESELHLLADVAERADARIIVDLAHLVISNRNQGRADDYGWHALPLERVVEVHLAGMRAGRDGRFWHDAHGLDPAPEVIAQLQSKLPSLPGLQAITLEHDVAAPLENFLNVLRALRERFH